MRQSIFLALAFLLAPTLAAGSAAEEPAELSRAAVDRLMADASIFLRGGDLQGALEKLDRAVAGAPQDLRAVRGRGRVREELGLLAEAAEDYSAVLEKHPDDASLWNRRGGLYFKMGRVDDSIRDFDEAVRLRPATEAGHWQRGISYYYAGRYGDCRRQFELHRTVNPDDVENAAWHFLCAARERGASWAREQLIPIEAGRDARVPMAEIYRLFEGSGTPGEVLSAAAPDEPGDAASRRRHNYAHLYLGLWHDLRGETAEARHHLALAAGRYRVDDVMGYVSRVHLERMPDAAR